MERELGWGPHAASERLRVAHELLDLPLLHDEFLAGTRCFSVVRELTRVATAQTEEVWLDRTRRMTARQVEHVVKGRKKGDTPDDRPDPALDPREAVLRGQSGDVRRAAAGPRRGRARAWSCAHRRRIPPLARAAGAGPGDRRRHATRRAARGGHVPGVQARLADRRGRRAGADARHARARELRRGRGRRSRDRCAHPAEIEDPGGAAAQGVDPRQGWMHGARLSIAAAPRRAPRRCIRSTAARTGWPT